MRCGLKLLMVLMLVAGSVAGFSAAATAATDCAFTTTGSTMALTADCVTDSTILVPDGFTLDGHGHAITAVDPVGGHFTGAVVKNGGATANVINLTVRAAGLADVCDAGDQRLRGIMFQGAGGSILNDIIDGINQGPSGCQEGNAIEVRNFDDAAGTTTVEIAGNVITNYQKSGIVANGAVDAWIHHNTIGASATQAQLAANSVQIGFGGAGVIEHNQIAGNTWCCDDAAATAVLLYQAVAPVVRQNNIDGNADLGIDIESDGALVDNNRVFESGADGFYDIGIGSYGAGNAVTNNKVRGYTTAYDGVTDGNNKSIPNH